MQLTANKHKSNVIDIKYHILDLKIDSELFYKSMKISNSILKKSELFQWEFIIVDIKVAI